MNKATNIEKNASNIINNNSRQLWCNYAWTIRNYVVSCLGNLPDTTVGKGWVIDSIYAIAESTKPNFGDSLSRKLTQSLYSVFILLLDKAEALKDGEEFVKITDLDLATISSLAELMHSMHPSWEFEKWMTVIELTFNLMLNQVIARAANEWVLDMKYQQAILEQFTEIADTFMVVSNAGFLNLIIMEHNDAL